MDIVPITIWRESRGEGEAGMIAVAEVIHNRTKTKGQGWPTDPEQVCMQDFQFSSWNNRDSNRNLYPKPNDSQYEMAVSIWYHPEKHATKPDPTNGATFYRNVATAGPFPSQYQVTAVIGNHTFAVLATTQVA